MKGLIVIALVVCAVGFFYLSGQSTHFSNELMWCSSGSALLAAIVATCVDDD